MAAFTNNLLAADGGVYKFVFWRFWIFWILWR